MARTDAELVRAVLEGDSRAFEEIVTRYQRLVFNIIYHYLGYANDVEDLSQEVFLKVYRALESFDTARPLKSWISRITANTCLDHIRRRRTRQTFVFSDLEHEDEQQLEYFLSRFINDDKLNEREERELFVLLEKAMAQLNEKDKMAFVLRELEGLSYTELAEIMETTELAARIRVSRSKQKLQKILGKVLYSKGRKRQ